MSAWGCLLRRCLPRGVCLGVSARGVCLPGGRLPGGSVCQGGVCLGVSGRGVCLPGSRLIGGCLPDPIVNRMTDRQV